MPPVKRIDTLPAELRAELDRRAAAAGFGDVRGLSAWLGEQGWEIGKTAVGEHVKALKTEYDDTMREVRAMAELSRILVEADPDQQAALNDMAGRLLTDQLVRAAKALRDAQDLTVEERIPLLHKLARPITEAQRAAIAQRRHSADVLEAARAAAREAARAEGVDDATAERIAAGVRIYLPDNQRRGNG